MSGPDDFGQLLVEVGQSLRTVRERDGWSVGEMAVIAGLEESEVRAIEAGESAFDTETLGKLLTAIGFASGFSDAITGSVEETNLGERYRITPDWMRRLRKPFSAGAGWEE